jgi:hypothetical protein
MAMLKMGLGFEDRLIGYLQRQQFDISHDPTLDHEYKIDFVIRKFPGNPKFHSLGVQVTTRAGDTAKMREFASIHSTDYRVVDKVVYLEVDPNLDFEKGVGHLIATGLSEFQFNTAHQADKMAGIKINGDMTFSIFDISTMLSGLAKAEIAMRSTPSETLAPNPQEQAPVKPILDLRSATTGLREAMTGQSKPQPPKVTGFINAYYRNRDHGFITDQTGESFYFELKDVSDGQLRDRLLALPQIDWGAAVEGTVDFQNAGKTRPNARYPQAKGIRFAK